MFASTSIRMYAHTVEEYMWYTYVCMYVCMCVYVDKYWCVSSGARTCSNITQVEWEKKLCSQMVSRCTGATPPITLPPCTTTTTTTTPTAAAAAAAAAAEQVGDILGNTNKPWGHSWGAKPYNCLCELCKHIELTVGWGTTMLGADRFIQCC